MSSPVLKTELEYPSDDGEPMADNTLQFQWIQVLVGNLQMQFCNATDDVFVGGNLLWYPEHGSVAIRRAPDAFVVFGRPQQHRSSYLQWQELNVPMTVIFEVRSPNDGDDLMAQKLAFYDRYGAEEYYLIDPELNTLDVYRRGRRNLTHQRIAQRGYVSPRLRIRLNVVEDEVRVYYPDGRPFVLPQDFGQRAIEAEQSQLEAEQSQQAAEQAQQEAEGRITRILELSRRVRRGTATQDEVAELDRLEAEAEGS